MYLHSMLRASLLVMILTILMPAAVFGLGEIETSEAIQLKSPMTIVSTNNNGDQLGELLILRNDSAKEVAGVKVDWAAVARPVTTHPRVLLRGSLGQFEGPINPKRRFFIYEHGVSARHLSRQLRQRAAGASIELVFGITEVRYRDGSRWQADLIADSEWGPEAGCPVFFDKPLYRDSPLGQVAVQSQETLESRALRRVLPDYPPVSRELGLKAIVALEVTVSEEGKVIDLRIESGDERFHAEAIKAARQWEFSPLVVDGKPRKMLGELTFLFLSPNQ